VVRIEFSGSPIFSAAPRSTGFSASRLTSFKLGESREDFTLTTAKLRVIVDGDRICVILRHCQASTAL